MKSVLITGGTGSFGKEMVKNLLINSKVGRIIIFSRDEQKQFMMSEAIPEKMKKRVRFFIGDVRDEKRLIEAMYGVDTVIHAAAMKIVTTAEYDPFECVKTNVIGAQNVVSASLKNNVTKVIALSTDKACNPINLYGATKLVSDKIFVASNHLSGRMRTRFSVVRYGNVLGSRGSVLPIFLKQIKNKKNKFYITHPDMTRFSITLLEGVNFVMKTLGLMNGGEIFVPKIPSLRILTLGKTLEPNFKIEFTGVRPGEKIHETLISKHDARNTIEFNNFFIIKPEIVLSDYRRDAYKNKFKKVGLDFEYSSDKNSDWLNDGEIKKMVDLFQKNAGSKIRFDE